MQTMDSEFCNFPPEKLREFCLRILEFVLEDFEKRALTWPLRSEWDAMKEAKDLIQILRDRDMGVARSKCTRYLIENGDRDYSDPVKRVAFSLEKISCIHASKPRPERRLFEILSHLQYAHCRGFDAAKHRKFIDKVMLLK